MNRNRAALVGPFALAVLVQASAGREPAGPPAPEGAEAGVGASLTATNPATVLTLVNTIDTSSSSWWPPSPDPTGLTYRTDAGRILVCDSEVDEVLALFTGHNLFEATRAGVLVDTGSLTARTSEPADIAWDTNATVLFVADDDLDKIFRINPQADGRFGTADDTSETTYTTTTFGSDDIEGLAYNPADRSLWAVDGTLVWAYHLERGADGQFDTADDIITSWDARPVGMRQPEGIAHDSASDHLFLVDRDNHLVAEATTTGSLVALFDLSASPVIAGSAIALAPASRRAGTNLYVADRGVDNDVDPAENDGKIFEFARTVVAADIAPIVANPGGQFHVEGDVVSLQVIAFEPNGDPLSYSAVGLPDGLSIDPGTGLITGTLALGASAASPHSVQVSASDGGGADTESFLWTVLAAPTCDDSNPCTADAFDQASGGCVHTPVAEGTPCTDGNACTPSDTCQAGNCVGSSQVPVSEPYPLLFESTTAMSWPATSDATHWNTYSGTIPSTLLGSRALSAVYDHVCLESGDALGDGATTTTDPSDPRVGTAYYYLDSGEGTCGESDLGHASSGAEIPNNSPCPTPP